MKLLLILTILFKIIYAGNSVNLKLKTETNRALILKQNTLNDFYPFIGNPWFEDEKFSEELLNKYIYAIRFIKNKKVLNDKSNFINMPVLIYEYTGVNVRSDKEILLGFSKKDWYDYQPFQYASKSLKKDKEFVNVLLDRGDNVYPYIDESLKDDETIIRKSMKLSELNYKRLPKKYRKDKQLTMQAVKKYGYLLEYADESLKDDMDVVKVALNAHLYAMPYASKRIRNNKSLFLELLSKDPSFLEYASKDLKKDKDIITLAIAGHRTNNFKLADTSLKKDKAYIRMLIKKDGNVLRYADKSLQNNPELVKIALDNGLTSLNITSVEIQKNRNFALKALSNSRRSIQYAHSSLYEDPIYMNEAIKRDPFNIKYVKNNKLKDNIDLALQAIKQDVQAYIYLSKKLQKNSLIKAYLPKEKKVHKFSIMKPHSYKTKGAIRGISISFLVVSKERSAKYNLVSPPKGMKIIKHIIGESCLTPYLGKGMSSGVVVKWDVPMDAEEGKSYNITVQGINKEGDVAEVTFPIKVPKTKPIQTTLVNNELTVTDKNSPLYGMKMKGHSGEDISELKLRSVEYGDVWRKKVKKKSPEDVVERIVFAIDNMPEALDVKMPEWMDTYEERIKIGMHSYKYLPNYILLFNVPWDNTSGQSFLYENTDGYIYLHKNNGSEIFFIILEKAQNKGK